MEDGTSFSGNSNNVFTTGNSEMVQSNNTWRMESNNQMFAVSFDSEDGGIEGQQEQFFPIFDNTILIDPIQRQREHYVTTHAHQTAVFSAPQRSIGQVSL